MLFAAASGGCLFLFAMGAGSGKLGIWELTAAFLGFLTYIHTLSDLFFPLFSRLYRMANAFLTEAYKKLHAFSKQMKKAFKKSGK